MLPRHLRRSLPPSHLLRQIPQPVQHHQPFRIPSSSFHSSSRRRNEVPRSPFQIFVEVLKEELQKDREHQESLKQLRGKVDSIQDAEAMKRAREVYEKARLRSRLQENPRLRAAAEELRKAGGKVGDAVSVALKTMEESEIMRAISRASAAVSESVDKATEPIRNTAAYKSLADTVIDALDDSGSAKHAGYEEKEARRRRRQMRLAKAGKEGRLAKRVVADPEAGASVVLHASSTRESKWEKLKETNPIFQRLSALSQSFDESENSVVSVLRSARDTVKGWFDETEFARVMRLMKMMDPEFNRESFERELREYIVPEVVDAYLSADKESLRIWCGEATYSVLWATMEQYLRQGLTSDSKVLDIRQVDIQTAKLLEDEVPVFVITFATQEVLLFRNTVTKEVIVGAEDKVEQCHYAAVITRVEEEIENEITGGWKIVDMARRSARAYL